MRHARADKCKAVLLAPVDLGKGCGDLDARLCLVKCGTVFGDRRAFGVNKILAGKINRFFSENCLENQAWVKDDKTSLKKLKPAVKVKRFVRWAIGEDL